MKHITKRGCILLVTFLFPLSAIIFPSFFRVQNLEDLAWGFVMRGIIFSLVGMMVLFDTFFFYRKGFFQKRNHKLIDTPFVISLIFVFFGILSLVSGARQLITGNFF